MMGAVSWKPGQYGGQTFKEVGGQGEYHLGIHRGTWLVASEDQVGHDSFFQ